MNISWSEAVTLFAFDYGHWWLLGQSVSWVLPSHHSNVAEWRPQMPFSTNFLLGMIGLSTGKSVNQPDFQERSGFQHGMLPTCFSSDRNGGIKPAILVISSECMYCKRERSNLWPSVVVLPENFPNAAIWGCTNLCLGSCGV
jgi:hypothetical protein